MDQLLIRVLVIDDANDSRVLIEMVLQMQPDIQWVGSEDSVGDTMPFLAHAPPNVILLGLRHTAYEDMARLRQAFAQVPVILTGVLRKDWATKLVSSLGADGYVDKAHLFIDLVPEIKRLADRNGRSK